MTNEANHPEGHEAATEGRVQGAEAAEETQTEGEGMSEEPYPVAEYIEEAMEARGWDVADLALAT